MRGELKIYIIILVILIFIAIGGLVGLGFFLYYGCDYTLFQSVITPTLVIVVSVGINLFLQGIYWIIKKVFHLE